VLVTGTVPLDATGKIVNVANVHSRRPDPVPHNNTATSTVRVTPLPSTSPDPGPQPLSNLVVTKHASRATVRQGQRVTYKITVTNTGPDAARDVRVIDAPRLPLKLLSVRTGQGSCHRGPTVRCRLGTLRNHSHTTITITVVATIVGVQTNAAVVMSGSWDPALRRSLALARIRIVRAHHRHHAVRPSPPRFTG
jgi:uncharacterized repeat protein (TIGR01451 family)